MASVPTCGPERRELARHRIEVNALGQRDRPRKWARTPGHQRVLVLGDSFVEATQVDLEDTFPARLEGATGIEMLNAGVSGYSTDNELRFFRVGGAPYRPDLVLLVLHTGNDVLENGPRLFLQNPHGLLPKPWLRSTDSSVELAACLAAHRATAAFADALPLFVWRHSAATRFLLTQGVATGIGVPCRPWTGPSLVDGVPELLGVFGEPPTDAWREGWTVTEELLGTLRDEVRATGAAFAVLIAPSIFEVTSSASLFPLRYPQLRGRVWDFAYPARRLGAYFDREGIPWLGVLEPLRAKAVGGGRGAYYPIDNHWNANGHAVVAHAARPFVEALLSARP